MKITAYVGPDGRVVGTMRRTEGSDGIHGTFVVSPGHSVHEIDLTDEDVKLRAPELHEKINKMLGGTRKPPR
jgi:hypothetical protein